MAEKYFRVDLDGPVAVVTIENPPMNQLSSEVLEEMLGVFQELDKNESVRAVVLTGGGRRVFIAGADIKQLSAIESAEMAEPMLRAFHGALNYIENMRKPVIAAINGYCLGGGLETALACHIRIAARKAQLGVPEIKLGIFPGAGGTQRLPRVVGKAKALEMILTGEFISAEEALRLNLVNQVVEDAECLEKAKALARVIAEKGRISVVRAMNAVIEGFEKSLQDGIELEMENFKQIAVTEDAKEGIAAFLEKREPRFKDR
ncbi:MAG: enoyl-CoA hydratase/isomerase family protein [Deltaproteobacteria bacterium]|nr:enoyl-CoA hydratase/isomerase family protein [Deltaproteobacteria bacterium]